MDNWIKLRKVMMDYGTTTCTNIARKTSHCVSAMKHSGKKRCHWASKKNSSVFSCTVHFTCLQILSVEYLGKRLAHTAGWLDAFASIQCHEELPELIGDGRMTRGIQHSNMWFLGMRSCHGLELFGEKPDFYANQQGSGNCFPAFLLPGLGDQCSKGKLQQWGLRLTQLYLGSGSLWLTQVKWWRHRGVSEEIQTTVPWVSQQLGRGQCRVNQWDFGELLPFCSLAVAGHYVVFTGIQFFIFTLLKTIY